LTYFLFPFLKKGDDAKKAGYEVTGWKSCAPMLHARSNFAAFRVKDYVYVFGGISGVEGDFIPKLAGDAVEMYTVSANDWTTIAI